MNNYTSRGALAVVFIGNDIHIDSYTYLGWQPLSKEMMIADFPRNINQTCSFGVTAYKKNESIEMLVDRVDKALYEAKRLGRNCVVTK